MASVSQLSERGQITIDKAIRKKLGLKPGMIAHQRVADGSRLEIVFLPVPHRDSLAGILHREGAAPGPLTGEELEQAVMEAVAEKHRAQDCPGARHRCQRTPPVSAERPA